MNFWDYLEDSAPLNGDIVNVRPIYEKYEPLSIFDIYCKCQTPKFERCQKCIGCTTCFCNGCGLFCCICNYGAKPDLIDVCLSGMIMQLTGSFVIGWVVSLIVGLKMMCQ